MASEQECLPILVVNLMSCLEELVGAVCRTINASQSLRVKGPSVGYRNKITYSLFPALVLSPLGMNQVNDLASAIDSFRRQPDLPATPMLPKSFWFEVCVKITRRSEYMVKVAFLSESVAEHCPSDFDRWVDSGEKDLFVQFLQEKEPLVKCIVAHVANEPFRSREDVAEEDDDAGVSGCGISDVRTVSAGKPRKVDRYVPLTADAVDHVVEYTPNGVPFALSADSFCEVNHMMEDAIFDASVEFLRLAPPFCTTEELRNKRLRAWMTGRDVNSVVSTFQGYYSEGVVCVSTCPRVLADTAKNNIDCVPSTKDNVWQHLALIADKKEKGVTDQHVLITAGRHGLHPNTVKELVRYGRGGIVDEVLYVSCNVESMIRDVYIFKEGFFIANCRTFDFFPGTKYVMTVMHLRAIPLPQQKRLLVLPIGPPGVGKSSAAAFALKALQSGATPTTVKAARKKYHEMRKRARDGVVSIARTLDVDLAANVAVVHVERDRLFRECRDSGLSLKETRAFLHRTLLEACRQLPGESTTDPSSATLPFAVTILDSTNGSAEARELYSDHSRSRERGGGCDALSLTLEVTFAIAAANHDEILEELLRRCKARAGHPGFPESDVAQREKIATIMSALEHEAQEPRSVVGVEVNGRIAQTISSRPCSDAESVVTCAAFSTLVYFYTLCAPNVAAVLWGEINLGELMKKWT